MDCCDILNIPKHVAEKISTSSDKNLKESVVLTVINKLDSYHKYSAYNFLKISNEYNKKSRQENFLWVEPLESFGRYSSLPSEEIITPLSSYTFINNKPYLLTLTKRNHQTYEDDDFYSEQKWVDKETAILIANINLSIEYGWCDFFIGEEGFYFPIFSYDMSKEELSSDAIKKLHSYINLHEYVNKKTNSSNHLPQNNFSFVKNISIKNIHEINSLIDRKDKTLIRCLYYYAKACSYASHKMTMEESTGLQAFCLDGLSKMMMNKYKLTKIKDLSQFLLKKFNCPYGDWMEEMYDERSIYVHPKNYHGEYWCPPWDADTCFDTLPVLKAILLLYIRGEYEEPAEHSNNF